MEFNKVALVVFSIFVSVGVPVLLVFLLHRINVLPIEKVFHPQGKIFLFGIPLFLAYYVFMFFFLQSVLLAEKPLPDTPVATQQALISQLTDVFSQKGQEDKELFTTKVEGNKMLISWSAEAFYYQGVAVGEVKRKRVFALHFNESNKSVYLVQKDVDFDWNASTESIGFKYNFNTGIYGEKFVEYRPTVIDKEGNIGFDLNKISYSSDEIATPLKQIITDSGWTLRSGMIESKALMALCVLVTFLLMLLLTYGTSKIEVQSYKEDSIRPADQNLPMNSTQTVQSVNSYDQASAIASKATPEYLKSSLTSMMMFPDVSFSDETVRNNFFAFGDVYKTKAPNDTVFIEDLDRKMEHVKNLKQ